MATNSTATLTIKVIAPDETRPISPAAFVTSTGIDEVHNVALASGDNIITIPTGAKAVCIIPPDGNAVALRLKGLSGGADVGLPIHENAFFFWAFPGGGAAASFIINAASAISGYTKLHFI